MVVKQHRSMRNYSERMKLGIIDLCQFLPEEAVVIEVGSYAGESTALFLSSDKISHLHCIDPFDNQYYGTTELDAAERSFDAVIKEQKHRVTKHRGRSDVILQQLIDKGSQVDLIYIDGSHRYDDVKSDIALAMKVVKPNGIIAGHDYDHPKNPQVNKAINETIGQPDVKFADYSWLKFKNRL